MEIKNIRTMLILTASHEELAERVAIYLQSMPLIIKILGSDQSSTIQRKSAITMLEHFSSQLQELYNQT